MIMEKKGIHVLNFIFLDQQKNLNFFFLDHQKP